MKPSADNHLQEKPIFSIEDTDSQASSQEIFEEPVITIESDDDDNTENTPQSVAVKTPSKLKRWSIHLLKAVAVIVLVLGCYGSIRLYNYYYNIGMSISVSPKENIGKLAGIRSQNGQSGIVLKTDSILGVALNIYELHNVRAEMTLVEPDTADQSVLLYTRTADYTPTGKYQGTLVIDGEQLQSDASRLGYCAIAEGNMVIGISRSDKVKSYVVGHNGSYFRQFVLISNGELPHRFFLHGKVERKALGRTADDRLYIIETCHAETLWDFADALREYGFVDAIYLTGGNESGLWRDSNGRAHFTEAAARYRTEKHHGVAPWLVLKKK